MTKLTKSANRKLSAENLREHEPMVKDLMTRELFTVTKADTLEVILALMAWKKIRHVPVVDESERLIGLVSQRDCLKVAVSSLATTSVKKIRKINRKLTAGEIFKPNVKSVYPKTMLSEAADIMFECKYGCLPVINDEEKLIGILTEADFVRSFRDWKVSFTKF